MSSSVGKKHIAHTGSGHGCVFPAAASLMNPPVPPAPSPFPYTARAANAKDTDGKIMVGGSHPVLIEKSTIALDPPANQPSQAGGGDVVTHAVKNIGVMQNGSWALSIRGKEICCTGDMCALNVIAAQSSASQAIVPLLEAGDFETASGSVEDALFVNEYYASAYPPKPASQTRAGDPIDIGSGHVVSNAADLELPGFIPLTWFRNYSSASHDRTGALGKGGWTHSFEQHIEQSAKGLRFWSEFGLPIDFSPPPPSGFSFHRGEGLELRTTEEGFEIYDKALRLTRRFAKRQSYELTSLLRPDEQSTLFGLVEVRDPYGHLISLDYDGARLVRIVDSVGRELRIENDAKGRIVRVEVWARAPQLTPPSAPIALQRWLAIEYTYHAEGELASHTDPLGNVAYWDYDGLHRLTRTRLKNGVSFQYEYHPEHGRCVRTHGDGGLHDVKLDLDFEKGEARTHGTHRARLYTFRKGVVLSQETFDGSWKQERRLDEDGLVIAEINGAGEKVDLERDARGNIVLQRDAAENEWRWEYAGDRPVRWIEPGEVVTTCSYDAGGQLRSIAFPSGTSIQLERDREGLLRSMVGPDGAKTTLHYDDHGNLVSESWMDGQRNYRWDALGRMVESVDSSNRRTRIQYDLVGRPVDMLRPDGTRIAATYDALGKPASVTNGQGLTSKLEYVGTGRLAKLTLPDGQSYRFLYDADARLTEVINPRLESYRYEYTRADHVSRETTFDGVTTEYRYDVAGRVIRMEHSNKDWREFRYDKCGQVVEDRGEDVQVTFERDQLGRIVTATSKDFLGEVVTTLERDFVGRLAADVQSGRAVRYEYDPTGMLAARTLPGPTPEMQGERTSYRWNRRGQLVGVAHDLPEGRGSMDLTIERDPFGREKRRRTEHWSLESACDAMDRLAAQKLSSQDTETPVLARTFRYDGAGRLTHLDAKGANQQYGYDARGQLVEATTHGVTELFEYDPAGAVVGRAKVGEELQSRWVFGKGSRLRSAGKVQYVDDARGRRIQERVGDQTTTYGWDSKNRLREVVTPDGTRVRFQYDAFGRRVRKDVLLPKPAQAHEDMLSLFAAPERRTTRFLWDRNTVCEEILDSPSGTQRRVHVHERGTHVPLMQSQDGETFAVVTDHLGAPLELVDQNGDIAWRTERDAWGEPIVEQRAPGYETLASPFGLLGQTHDADIGLSHTLHRYFDRSTARWLTPDPIGMAGGMNLFGFDGAPTHVADPLGLLTEPQVLFGQKRAAPTFRDIGPNEKLAGKTLAEVAEMIRSGEIHPDEITVRYFVGPDGRLVAEGNRGLAVLAMAGMQPTVTEEVPSTTKLVERLDEGPLPSAQLPITTQKDGSGLQYTVDLREGIIPP